MQTCEFLTRGNHHPGNALTQGWESVKRAADRHGKRLLTIINLMCEKFSLPRHTQSVASPINTAFIQYLGRGEQPTFIPDFSTSIDELWSQ
eukprot:788979-Amphidinium_carterae.1